MFLILFWFALTLGAVAFVGAVAEKSTGMVCLGGGFAVVAYGAAAGAQWL